jgi:AmmeMemoRadiSam system protein B/AmmeMemoRadiSam system protein A
MPRYVCWGFLLLWTVAAATLAVPINGLAQRVRAPAVAGSWYPGEAPQLADELDRLLAQASASSASDPPTRIRALIVPHAAYRYSGATAAAAFRALVDAEYQRVIVIGPAHRAAFHGISIAAVSHYQTPLGKIALDDSAIAALRADALVVAHPTAHHQEHSIEMQLPFLQRTLKPGWKLLPLLVGEMAEDDYPRAAALLRPFSDANTLLVVSSDFTHYGEYFSYLPFAVDEHTAARLEQLDNGALAPILARDPHALLAYQRRTGITICGFRPIALLLHLLPAYSEGAAVSYATSGALVGDYHHSVSYLSVLFRERQGAPPLADERLSETTMRWLHQLAVRAVSYAARHQDQAARERLLHWLEAPPADAKPASGVFVTLKKQDMLRGCIGYIQGHKPIFQAVAENGINAALNDHRFAPLTADELADLDVEVSVLSVPRQIDAYEHFQVGEHGIILHKDGRSAVFLPEVAIEQDWDRNETLTHLSREAGLPADAWKNGAHFQVFRTQKISAPLLAPSR